MSCANIVVAHNLEFDLTVLITSGFKYEIRTEDDKQYLDNFFFNGKITWSFYLCALSVSKIIFNTLGKNKYMTSPK